jgi:FixJ family two-component response regulator
MDAIELQHILKKSHSPLALIVLCASDQLLSAVELMRQGAVSVLERPISVESLQAAIREAVDLAEKEQDLALFRHNLEDRLRSLRPIELQVLDLVVAGHRNQEIAKELKLGLRTVESYRNKIMSKTHSASLAELIRLSVQAFELGLRPRSHWNDMGILPQTHDARPPLIVLLRGRRDTEAWAPSPGS